jgi:hypothetical protein
MNKLNLNQTGGFPLSTNILDAMQTAYSVFNSLGNLAGNLAIISGCNITGTTVSDGTVYINGELLEFRSGNVGANVIIKEDAETRIFEDGSSKIVILKRYATFGTALTNYPWENFKRIFPTTEIKTFKDDHEALEKSVPIGLVAIWGKHLEDIPVGWAVHTPMQGLVPVGRKAGDVNFGAAAGTKIGTAEVTIEKSHLPNYNIPITVKDPYEGSESAGGFNGGGNIWKNKTINISTGGGGLAITNIQPSTIVDFIIFVGF